MNISGMFEETDIESAKANIEGVNALHKIAQNKSADRYITV